jgi:Tfp pilus assembly protein PilF
VNAYHAKPGSGLLLNLAILICLVGCASPTGRVMVQNQPPSAIKPSRAMLNEVQRMAVEYYKICEFDRAERGLRSLLKVDPENETAKYYLALVMDAKTMKPTNTLHLVYPTIPPQFVY